MNTDHNEFSIKRIFAFWFLSSLFMLFSLFMSDLYPRPTQPPLSPMFLTYCLFQVFYVAFERLLPKLKPTNFVRMTAIFFIYVLEYEAICQTFAYTKH